MKEIETKMKIISFKTTKAESQLITLIVARTVELSKKTHIIYPPMDCRMDITACHANGTPLDLERLLAADDFNFFHDVVGIRDHIDRDTGEIKGFFVPRFSARD